MSTLIEKIAEVLTEHHFWHQYIGPIHYICACREPHTQFCEREAWQVHQAEQVAAVVAEWLASPMAEAIVQEHRGGVAATLVALSNHAVKGADQ